MTRPARTGCTSAPLVFKLCKILNIKLSTRRLWIINKIKKYIFSPLHLFIHTKQNKTFGGYLHIVKLIIYTHWSLLDVKPYQLHIGGDKQSGRCHKRLFAVFLLRLRLWRDERIQKLSGRKSEGEYGRAQPEAREPLWVSLLITVGSIRCVSSFQAWWVRNDWPWCSTKDYPRRGAYSHAAITRSLNYKFSEWRWLRCLPSCLRPTTKRSQSELIPILNTSCVPNPLLIHYTVLFCSINSVVFSFKTLKRRTALILLGDANG